VRGPLCLLLGATLAAGCGAGVRPAAMPVAAPVGAATALPAGVDGQDYADVGRLVLATLPHPFVAARHDLAGHARQQRAAPASPDAATRDLVTRRRLGGVVLFGDDIRTLPQLAALAAGLHRAAGRRGLLVATDQEGGTVRRVPGAQPVASARALCAAGPAAVERVHTVAGRQLHDLGVDVDLAPVADLGVGGFLGTRAASQAPSACVRAAVRGLQHGSTAATAKHFPGLGGVRASTDDAAVTGPRVTGPALQPFRAAVQAGVRLVMVDLAGHPGLGRRPAAFEPSAYALLRGSTVGFTGVAVTDALDATAATAVGGQEETAVLAVVAGADLVLTAGGPGLAGRVVDALQAAVRSGRIPAHRLREALARVRALERVTARS
jgi:beta-N-acetylhexosaminidase